METPAWVLWRGQRIDGVKGRVGVRVETPVDVGGQFPSACPAAAAAAVCDVVVVVRGQRSVGVGGGGGGERHGLRAI